MENHLDWVHKLSFKGVAVIIFVHVKEMCVIFVQA